MQFTIKQIAHLINGEVQGDDSLTVSKLAKIEQGNTGDISFLANQKYEHFIYTTKASAVIVGKDFVPKKAISASLIVVDNPYLSFTQLLEEYQKILNFSKKGAEQPVFVGTGTEIGEGAYQGAFSYVGNNTKIGKNVKIYPQVYIGDNVVIGDNTLIYAGVKIYSNAIIGSNCVFHAGAVIGSDGFGFAPQEDGTYKTIPQLGNVVIEDNVSIGANTTIDCATMGSTIIHQGVKIDNLVQVAHNVEIGKNTVIAAQTGIAGSTIVGENCVLAGQVGVVGHISIANGTKVGAKAGVRKSIKQENTSITGTYAFELNDYMRAAAVFKRLPQLDKQVRELEKRLEELINEGVFSEA
ncbi:UDP-3-O-(3-hydroxymyristoyl)glucosamine N-acyltransferase [Emticicia sp. BO119]|uniref:UDP-3-O-(3-hydroxymyristoyl)glucosamine N-acyltransferase n=1 Tax=Emticicia sp. BO119 TaxID=2757768 RepID=UPI0015F01961|nr:UDP-3-O-(3-hydroxymyristoyl)glucosamine N-acyltransferase [Emticicia sp. BO119]MBA4851158.1 UDP-3-O-(3-hydroxymyristoyl)glucosamine N-acyltransferase [Emticicia sp. BO119]